MKKRILFTGRDPGAAGHLIEIARSFAAHPHFDTHIMASGVAVGALTRAGLSVEEFGLPDGRTAVEFGDEGFRLLIDLLRPRFEALAPDAVFTSISSMNLGLDEAALYLAKNGGRACPAFVLQDFWGYLSGYDGYEADTYFLIDRAAREITRRRTRSRLEVVGSPRNETYARMDIPALREKTRADLGVTSGEKLVGFFAQTSEVPGHDDNFRKLVDALRAYPGDLHLLLRAHPKLADPGNLHLEGLRSTGHRVTDVTRDDAVEPSLAACDLVCTCFSNVHMDHAFLCRHSPAPLGATLLLMAGDEIKAFVEKHNGFWRLPYPAAGIGKMAVHADEIRGLLFDLLSSPDAAEVYHESCRKLPGSGAVARIVRAVERRLLP